jgi:hypothetical protein
MNQCSLHAVMIHVCWFKLVAESKFMFVIKERGLLLAQTNTLGYSFSRDFSVTHHYNSLLH